MEQSSRQLAGLAAYSVTVESDPHKAGSAGSGDVEMVKVVIKDIYGNGNHEQLHLTVDEDGICIYEIVDKRLIHNWRIDPDILIDALLQYFGALKAKF